MFDTAKKLEPILAVILSGAYRGVRVGDRFGVLGERLGRPDAVANNSKAGVWRYGPVEFHATANRPDAEIWLIHIQLPARGISACVSHQSDKEMAEAVAALNDLSVAWLRAWVDAKSLPVRVRVNGPFDGSEVSSISISDQEG